MKKTIIGLVACVILLMMVSTIKAQVQKGDMLLIAQGGIAVPITNELWSVAPFGFSDETIGKVGGAVGAQFVYHVLDFLGLGIDFEYALFGENSYSKGTEELKDKPTVWTIMPIARILILPDNTTRPYLIMGIGYANINRRVEVVGISCDEDSSGGFASMIGAGIDFDITEQVFAGIGAKWLYTTMDEEKVPFLVLPHSAFSFYKVMAHIGFKFGRK